MSDGYWCDFNGAHLFIGNCVECEARINVDYDQYHDPEQHNRICRDCNAILCRSCGTECDHCLDLMNGMHDGGTSCSKRYNVMCRDCMTSCDNCAKAYKDDPSMKCGNGKFVCHEGCLKEHHGTRCNRKGGIERKLKELTDSIEKKQNDLRGNKGFKKYLGEQRKESEEERLLREKNDYDLEMKRRNDQLKQLNDDINILEDSIPKEEQLKEQLGQERNDILKKEGEEKWKVMMEEMSLRKKKKELTNSIEKKQNDLCGKRSFKKFLEEQGKESEEERLLREKNDYDFEMKRRNDQMKQVNDDITILEDAIPKEEKLKEQLEQERHDILKKEGEEKWRVIMEGITGRNTSTLNNNDTVNSIDNGTTLSTTTNANTVLTKRKGIATTTTKKKKKKATTTTTTTQNSKKGNKKSIDSSNSSSRAPTTRSSAREKAPLPNKVSTRSNNDGKFHPPLQVRKFFPGYGWCTGRVTTTTPCGRRSSRYRLHCHEDNNDPEEYTEQQLLLLMKKESIRVGDLDYEFVREYDGVFYSGKVIAIRDDDDDGNGNRVCYLSDQLYHDYTLEQLQEWDKLQNNKYTCTTSNVNETHDDDDEEAEATIPSSRMDSKKKRKKNYFDDSTTNTKKKKLVSSADKLFEPPSHVRKFFPGYGWFTGRVTTITTATTASDRNRNRIERKYVIHYEDNDQEECSPQRLRQLIKKASRNVGEIDYQFVRQYEGVFYSGKVKAIRGTDGMRVCYLSDRLYHTYTLEQLHAWKELQNMDASKVKKW